MNHRNWPRKKVDCGYRRGIHFRRLGYFFLLSLWLILLHDFSSDGKMAPQIAAAQNQSVEKTGVEQKTIMPESPEGLGVQEVERPDGGRDKIYYSITTPEEEARSQKEEKEKLDKSLDVPNNIIIDNRRIGNRRR
jgi:hypothetical protein